LPLHQNLQVNPCGFLSGRARDICLGLVPGGGGGGGKDQLSRITKANAPAHIAHGHHIDSAGHRWPANWVQGATDALTHSPRQVLRGQGVASARILELLGEFMPGEGGSGSCGPGTPRPCLPDTPNITTPAEGDFQAVGGAFGMPAIAPKHEFVGKFVCPPGFVLGEDNLCYPKQVLRRDSRFRKHRPGVRPILTGGQRNAIRKARTAITTARDAISGLGVTVQKKK